MDNPIQVFRKLFRVEIRSLRFTTLVLFLTALSATTNAQLVKGRFITSFYTWEKFDTVETSTTFSRGFQVFQLDIAQGDFSLHSHLQGAATFVGKTATADFRTQHLYGRWKNIGNAFDLSFGRMPYFHGVGNGTLDGVRAAIRLAEDRVSAVFYGGAPPPLDYTLKGWSPLSSAYLFGGQLLYSHGSHFTGGISYVNKARERESYWTTRADSLFNPAPFYVEPELRREQYTGIDVRYLFTDLQLYGRYDYNLFTNESQRGDFRALYSVSSDVTLNATYQFRSPRLPWNSFFSVFDLSNTHEVEAGMDVVLLSGLRCFVRGALVQFDGDESFRYSVGGYWTHLSLSYRGSSGNAGELNSVSLNATYPLLNRLLIPNGSFSWNSYSLSETAPKEETLALALGMTVRPLPAFAFDVQGQWLSNSIYKNDLRIFGKLNFWFTEMLNIL